jgi:hypothetical protein
MPMTRTFAYLLPLALVCLTGYRTPGSARGPSGDWRSCLNGIDSKMKLSILAATVVLFAGGCAPIATRPPLAGIYASNLVATGSFPWVDGKSYPMFKALTLTLYPNGTFCTGIQLSTDAPIRFSCITGRYDLQENSKGSWILTDDRLQFRSVDSADGLGPQKTPEQSEAVVSFEKGTWNIVWIRTEYQYKERAPNQPPL